MIGVTEVLLVIFLVLITHLFISVNKRPKKYPPGPFQIPIVGYLPFMNRVAPNETLSKLKNQYGEAFSLRLGVRDVVYLNSWKLAKEAFNHPDVQGRPPFFSFRFIHYGTPAGVVLSDGDLWVEQRRFTLRYLRDFGFGKLSFESIILREIEKVEKSFSEHDGKPFEISASMNMAIVNIIWKMVADLELDTLDPEFMRLTENIEKSLEIVGSAVALDFLPWLNYIIPEKWSGLAKIRETRDNFYKFATKLIQDHRETLDDSVDRDFIDVYLRKIKEDKDRDAEDTTFTDQQLFSVIFELFIAGSETTATTLKFGFLMLLINPEVQRKVQEEILSVTNGERQVSLTDMKSLPYTEGFIMEIQRLSNIVPTSIPHAATTTVKIGDYILPKGTVVIANARDIHLNPEYWPEPEKIDPTRYINQDGSVNRKIDAFLPFSVGKRQCLGENLAKSELFLFVTNLLQKFTFSSPPGVTPPSAFDAVGGIVIHPDPYKLIATPLKRGDS